MSIFFDSSDVNDNEDEDISPQQKALLLGISYPITFLSLCAGIAVVTLFIRTWKNCSQIGKMGFCLTLANLIYTLTNLLPIILDSSADYFCYVDGPLRMFSTLSCIVWATKIAITAFRALVTEEYHPSHPLGVNWGFFVPIVVALCPLFPEGRYYIYYDTLGLNCNVYSKVKALRRVWPIMFNIIPMIISVVLTIYSNIKIIRFLKSQRTPFKIRTKRFIAYPLSLIVAWMPLNVFRFMYFVVNYSIWLDGIAIVFSRSSGLINALMYGWERWKAAHDINNNEILQEMCTKTAMEENTAMDDSYSDLSISMDEESFRRSSVHKL